MRGSHLYIEMAYANDTPLTIDSKFTCPYVKTIFRKSYR